MIQVNFHNSLNFLFERLNELNESLYEPKDVNPSCENNLNLTQKVELFTQITIFFEENANQFAQCDVHDLTKVQRMVHVLELRTDAHYNPYGQPSTIDKIIATSINLALVAGLHLPKDIEKVRSIPSSYARAYIMAQLINRDRIPIKDLPLSMKELMSISSNLTFLDCRDAFHGWKGEEVEIFLKMCSNVESLYINSPLITQLPSFPVCQILECNNCINLKQIAEFPLCHQFFCKGCTSLQNALGPVNQLQAVIDREIEFRMEYERLKPKIMAACEKWGASFSEYDRFMCKYNNSIDGILESDETPAVEAIRTNNFEILKVLTELGVDLNNCDNRGNSSLKHALMLKKDSNVIKLLVKLGADVNACDLNGVSTMQWAIMYDRDLATIRLLKELGADVNKGDNKGTTPLISASYRQRLDMIKLLAELGADVNKCNNSECSPLWYAASKNYCDMLILLKELGADVNKCNYNGYSPLMVAYRPEMVALLKKFGADYKYAEEANRRIFLAHLWGIDGKSLLIDKIGNLHILPLAGSKHFTMMQMLSSNVSDFFSTIDIVDPIGGNLLISKDDQLEIQDSIANGFPLSTDTHNQIVEKIKSGKPYVILAGCLSHAISIVIYNDQLIVFNRGLGKTAFTTNSFFLFKESVTEKLINDLTKNYPNIYAFNSMISNLNLPPTHEEFKQNDQKVGNCAWVSATGAFGILCRLYTNNVIGKMIYKVFKGFSREKGLSAYLEESEQIDIELLKKIEHKCSSKKQGLFLGCVTLIKTKLSTLE